MAFTTFALVVVRTLERPTWSRQLVMLAGLGVLVGVRSQALALTASVVGAIILSGVVERRLRQTLVVYRPTGGSPGRSWEPPAARRWHGALSGARLFPESARTGSETWLGQVQPLRDGRAPNILARCRFHALAGMATLRDCRRFSGSDARARLPLAARRAVDATPGPCPSRSGGSRAADAGHAKQE